MYMTTIVAGYLGKDPELKYTGAGDAVCTFSLATSKKSQGVDLTTWFRVTVWRKQAETCNQYLQKGRAVLVEGELQTDPETGGPKIWTGNDGTPRTSYELTAYTVRFLGGGASGPLPEKEQAASPASGYVSNEQMPF